MALAANEEVHGEETVVEESDAVRTGKEKTPVEKAGRNINKKGTRITQCLFYLSF